ncbi:DUF86 domain-containing protein [Thermus sp. LT1-2-5]|uniref:HepT-like ribonuclease domain-containing protein n=1 Tax=Thermus sp. LT1-2-5 TaxID=3026935 RepID=UPI0030E7F741
MRDPAERVRDMLEAIAAIQRYVGRGKEAFEQDELLQVWFVRHLEILGEAARGLAQDVRNWAQDIPWSKIIGMRNVLVHSYFQIDLDVVWNTVTKDLPVLKASLERLLDQLGESSPDR